MIDDDTFGGLLAFLTLLSGTCAGIALVRRCRVKSERARWSVFQKAQNRNIHVGAKQNISKPKLSSGGFPLLSSIASTASSTRRSMPLKTRWSTMASGRDIPDEPNEITREKSSQLNRNFSRLLSRLTLSDTNSEQQADVFDATVSKIDLSMRVPSVHDENEDEDPPELGSILNVSSDYHRSDSPLPPIKEDRSKESESAEESQEPLPSASATSMKSSPPPLSESKENKPNKE